MKKSALILLYWNDMKKVLYILLGLILITGSRAWAVNFQNENLKYVIMYKWGLIHKEAGDATLSLRGSGNHYNLMLTAKTRPWADRIYSVRDTLKGTVLRDGLKPIDYTKITHEKGKYKLDEVKYSRHGGVTKGETYKYRRNKEGKMEIHKQELNAHGPVYDMLSVFYYLRALDYSKLTKNKVYKATVFSGSKAETITIKCLGKEHIKLRDNSVHEAWKIKFNFTQKGGKKSSDDIDTWISTDSRHLPLYVVGKLPIGECRAYLVSR